MVDLPMAPIVPGAKSVGKAAAPSKLGTDSMQAGVHTDLRKSSKHKQMVSSVLQLKHASAGHRTNPSAFNTGQKAFKGK